MNKKNIILLLSILCLVFLGCFVLINKKEKPITIRKDDDNYIMGVNYKISNLKKDEYNVEIYAKEYNLGKLEKEHNLFEDNVKVEDKEILSVGVYEEDNELFSGINGDFISNGNIEFFNKSNDRGMSMSILDMEKKIELNKEIPICAYSVGKDDGYTTSIYDFELGINKYDLVIYLNINKVS